MFLLLLVHSCPCIFCSLFTAFKHLSFHAFSCSGFPSRLILLCQGPYAFFLSPFCSQAELSHLPHAHAVHKLKQTEWLTFSHQARGDSQTMFLGAPSWLVAKPLQQRRTSSLRNSCPRHPEAQTGDVNNVGILCQKVGDAEEQRETPQTVEVHSIILEHPFTRSSNETVTPTIQSFCGIHVSNCGTLI